MLIDKLYTCLSRMKDLHTCFQISAVCLSMKSFYCLAAWQVARPKIFLLSSLSIVIGLPATQVCYSGWKLPKLLSFSTKKKGKKKDSRHNSPADHPFSSIKRSESGLSSAWFEKVQHRWAWMAFMGGRAVPWWCGFWSDDQISLREYLFWLQRKQPRAFLLLLLFVDGSFFYLFNVVLKNKTRLL